MGEVADAMLNGDVCEMCGVYLENDPEMGIPMYCSEDCARDRGVPEEDIEFRIGKEI